MHLQDELMQDFEFEWRLACVRKVDPTRANRFQVCVQRRGGAYDEDFLEWCAHAASRMPPCTCDFAHGTPPRACLLDCTFWISARPDAYA